MSAVKVYNPADDGPDEDEARNILIDCYDYDEEDVAAMKIERVYELIEEESLVRKAEHDIAMHDYYPF